MLRKQRFGTCIGNPHWALKLKPGARRYTVVLAVILAMPSTAEISHSVSARIKWFGTVTALPERSFARQISGADTPQWDQNADLRLMWHGQSGNFQFIAEHTTAALQGDSVGASLQSELNQVVDNDNTRAADLTWRLGGGNGHRHASWHRFDRLAVTYQSGNWSTTLGRQAVSWGNGMVFQPMDLFNPFTPTAVDKDYKPGDDLLLVERLLDNGSDLQLLAVGRRDQDENLTGQAGSIALKWRSAIGEGEYEVLAARHFNDEVLGLGLRWPVGGALLRTDIVATRLEATSHTSVSAVVNMDYSFSLAERTAYVFAEYFYNGFGHTGNTPALSELSPALLARLERGELFNVQRSYLALGGNYQWHPLWTQSLNIIVNLHDSSTVLVTQLGFEPGDHQRLEFGLLANIGEPGDEYAGLFLAPAQTGVATDAQGRQLTAGGRTQGFVRWVYFF